LIKGREGRERGGGKKGRGAVKKRGWVVKMGTEVGGNL